jgi:hypothetical protein
LPERENALLQSSTDVHHHERDNTERRADPERNGLLRQVGELDPLRSVASATSGIRGVNRPHPPAGRAHPSRVIVPPPPDKEKPAD